MIAKCFEAGDMVRVHYMNERYLGVVIGPARVPPGAYLISRLVKNDEQFGAIYRHETIDPLFLVKVTGKVLDAETQ